METTSGPLRSHQTLNELVQLIIILCIHFLSVQVPPADDSCPGGHTLILNCL